MQLKPNIAKKLYLRLCFQRIVPENIKNLSFDYIWLEINLNYLYLNYQICLLKDNFFEKTTKAGLESSFQSF